MATDTNHVSPADETRQMLVDCRALLNDDHFVYISGDHGSGWVDKDTIFVDPRRVARLTQLLAAAVKRFDAEILCGPATGGAEVEAVRTPLAAGAGRIPTNVVATYSGPLVCVVVRVAGGCIRQTLGLLNERRNNRKPKARLSNGVPSSAGGS